MVVWILECNKMITLKMTIFNLEDLMLSEISQSQKENTV